MKKQKIQGFTLLELVITITIMGIMATVLTGIMSGAFTSYVWTVQNAALMGDLDHALQRMEKDLQMAVPLSARSSNDGKSLELLYIDNIFVPVTPPTGTSSNSWPVFVFDAQISPTLRTDPFVMNHKANYQLSSGILNFNCPTLGNAYCPAAGYPAGSCPVAVSAPAQQSINSSGLSSSLPLTISINNNAPTPPTGNKTTLTFISPNTFPSTSPPLAAPPTPAITFLYAVNPVLYRCETDGVLRRYINYTVGATIYTPTAGNAPGPGDTLLGNVKDCKFTVDPVNAKFVDLWIQVNKMNNTIDFASRVHVDIAP